MYAANLAPFRKEQWVEIPPSPRPEEILTAILSLTEDGTLSFTLDGVIQT
jgi:hypothetical protein